MEPPPVVILVHGAGHGAWAWSLVVERLTAEGIRTVAPGLPSKGHETALLGDLHDDAEAVRVAVEGAGAPALVIAHSVSRIDSGHAPFLSRPGELVAIIRENLATIVAGG